MELLTLLTATLGTAIAKALVSTWLEEPTTSQVAGDYLDLLRDKALNALQTLNPAASPKPQTIDDLEALGQTIAGQVRPHFDSEATRDPHLNRQAVVYALADTLKASRLDIDLLLQHNLNPTRLRQALLHQRDSRPTLSEVEANLYLTTLTDLCRQIILTADGLKGFHSLSTAALFEHLNEILRLLDNDQTSQQASRDAFEGDYRRALTHHFNKPDMFGIPYADHAREKQSLQVAYISLQVKTPYIQTSQFSDAESIRARVVPATKTDQQIMQLLAKRGERTELEAYLSTLPDDIFKVKVGVGKSTILNALLRGEIGLETQAVEACLASSRRVVITGEGGSGKTTLLQWIAAQAAACTFEAPLTTWNKALPFFIRLRRLPNDVEFLAPNAFPTLEIPTLPDPPPDWVVRYLRTGQAIVLIDGVDELPRERRAAMLTQLETLVATYPLPAYIITARPEALQDNDWPAWTTWVKRERFTTASLEPLTTQQIATFVTHWHRALAVAEDLPPAHYADLMGSLNQIIRHRPDLTRLMKSPLLCAMVCALHKERGSNLPAERLTLYRDCLQMLLDTRDTKRRLPVNRDYPALSFDHKLALLRRFAYWLMRNTLDEVDSSTAEARFAHYLKKTPGLEAEPALVRQFFVERATLLQEPVVGRLTFTHRSFQEYLTAQAIYEEADYPFLIEQANKDYWRQTIILTSAYIGSVRPKERTQFLTALLNYAATRPANEQRDLYLLAAACLENNLGLETAIQKTVLNKVTPFFPPRDEATAKIVAQGGDAVIPFLIDKPDYPDWQPEYCILTLGYIGSRAALEALESYHHRKSSYISSALGNIAQFFDEALFFQHIWASRGEVYLTQSTQLNRLNEVPHLNQLIIRYPMFNHTSMLRNLINLELLDLRETQVNDLSGLKNLTNLRWLDLNGTEVRDLRPLRNLINLEWLNLRETQINDLNDLRNLVNLEVLVLSGTKLNDLKALTSLTNLKNVYLDNNQRQLLARLYDEMKKQKKPAPCWSIIYN